MSAITSYINKFAESIKEALPTVAKYTLGLFNLFLLHVYDGKKITNSDVVVVLIAKDDHNGSLSIPRFPTIFRLHNQSHSKIIYKEMGSIDDVNAAITQVKDQNNRIKGLWINAHGAPQGIFLGKEIANYNHIVMNYNKKVDGKSIGSGNAKKLAAGLKKLENDCVIILDSCSTGKLDGHGNPSIAQTIAKLAPHRKVYAPNRPCAVLGTHLGWQDKDLTVRFKAPIKSTQTGMCGKLLNLFYICLFAYSNGHFGDDTTMIAKRVNNSWC